MIIAFGVAAVLAALQTPTPAQTGPLTLDDAIAIAERNAFSIRLAESNIEIARQRLSQARALLGPRINGSSSYNYLFNAQSTPFAPAQHDQLTVGANVAVPIDISGNTRRNIQASEASLAASRNTAKGTRNDVRLSVSRAYFGVLRTQGLVNVAEQALKQAQERATQGELLFQGDQIARVDLERLRTQVVQSESDLLNTRNSLALAQNAFNLAIAREIDTPVVLSEPESLPPVPSNTPTLVATAQQQRPEVLALSDTIRALERSRRAREAGMNPTLSAALGYTKTAVGANAFQQDESITGQLLLSVPIFDSGLTRAQVREARQNEAQAQINLEQLRLAISNEVRQAVTNLTTAQARMETANRQIALAEEVLRLAIIRQQAGEATPLEIVDAQTQLTQARNSAVSARYDYLTAYSELLRALGTTTVPTPVTSAAIGGTH